MEVRRAVIDTNVLFAGLYSSTGASHQILRLIDNALIVPLLSTALLFEYEDVLLRSQEELRLSNRAVEDVLDAMCLKGESRRIHFLWRPRLSDPKDDHVLELAVAASGADVVTHNRKDFAGAEAFGVRILTPAELLRELQ
jgi:putative PIN family toxin of toxin-antitoxin system